MMCRARVLCQETAILSACECAQSATHRRLKRSEAWCCHWIPGAQSSRLPGRQQLPHARYHLAVWRRASAALWIEYYSSQHAHTSPVGNNSSLNSGIWPRTRYLVCIIFPFHPPLPPFPQSLASRHGYFLLALRIAIQLSKKNYANVNWAVGAQHGSLACNENNDQKNGTIRSLLPTLKRMPSHRGSAHIQIFSVSLCFVASMDVQIDKASRSQCGS